jgi:DNA-binding transcriptional MerR regulator
MASLVAAPRGLLRASQIAEELGTLPSTIKHYRLLGLLSPVASTPGGYHLFDSGALLRAREIRRLQREERLSLEEIAGRLRAVGP